MKIWHVLAVAAVLVAAQTAQAVEEDDSPTLVRIAESGSINIGVRAQSAPFSFINQGVPRGYVVDLCRAIVAELKRGQHLNIPTIRYIEVTSKDRIEKVAKGEVDMECGSTTITADRLAKVEFSHMTFVTGLRALILDRYQAQSRSLLDTLDRGRIAIVDGTTAEKVLTWWKPEAKQNLLRVKDYSAGVAAVAAGKAYTMVGDEVLIESAVSEFKGSEKFAYSAIGYSVEPYGIALPKNDPAFVAAVNRALTKIYSSGRAEKMLVAWLGPRNLQINNLTRDALVRPGRHVSTPL